MQLLDYKKMMTRKSMQYGEMFVTDGNEHFSVTNHMVRLFY